MIQFWKILTPVSIKYIQSNGARALCSPWPWLSNISMYYHAYGTALRKHRKYEKSGVTNTIKMKHRITRFQSHSLVSLLREAVTFRRQTEWEHVEIYRTRTYAENHYSDFAEWNPMNWNHLRHVPQKRGFPQKCKQSGLQKSINTSDFCVQLESSRCWD